MEEIIVPVVPTYRERISPGVVGSVGDVLTGVRLRQSEPHMAVRYENNPFEQMVLGSNVQDGYSQSFSTGGGPARAFDPVPGNLRAIGWIKQDLSVPYRYTEPRMGSLGRYSMYNRTANIYEQRRTGALFQPLPGEYVPLSMPRGSQMPRVIETIGPAEGFTRSGDQRQPPPQQRQMVIECIRRDGTRERKRAP